MNRQTAHKPHRGLKMEIDMRNTIAMPSITPGSGEMIFPWLEPPSHGRTLELAPGLLWLRARLPYGLDHINIYLVADGKGWAVIDTGLGDTSTREMWEALLDGPLAKYQLTRVFVTHFHPDHVGLAGWLTERFGLALSMPRSEYLYSVVLRSTLPGRDSDLYRRFYQAHGLAENLIDEVLSIGHEYLHRTTDLPTSYTRLEHSQEISIGDRSLLVITGGGHSSEQAMFYCKNERLFFSADQVIARISPNISISPIEPHADPLRAYLQSLNSLIKDVSPDVLVLPGHGLPFRGLHERLNMLIAHHRDRCDTIQAACRLIPQSASDLLSVVFKRQLDAHQTGFAFGEVLAHINYMHQRGDLGYAAEIDGIQRHVAIR